MTRAVSRYSKRCHRYIRGAVKQRPIEFSNQHRISYYKYQFDILNLLIEKWPFSKMNLLKRKAAE